MASQGTGVMGVGLEELHLLVSCSSPTLPYTHDFSAHQGGLRVVPRYLRWKACKGAGFRDAGNGWRNSGKACAGREQGPRRAAGAEPPFRPFIQ